MIIVNRDRNRFTSETLKGWNYYLRFQVNSKKKNHITGGLIIYERRYNYSGCWGAGVPVGDPLRLKSIT